MYKLLSCLGSTWLAIAKVQVCSLCYHHNAIFGMRNLHFTTRSTVSVGPLTRISMPFVSSLKRRIRFPELRFVCTCKARDSGQLHGNRQAPNLNYGNLSPLRLIRPMLCSCVYLDYLAWYSSIQCREYTVLFTRVGVCGTYTGLRTQCDYLFPSSPSYPRTPTPFPAL